MKIIIKRNYKGLWQAIKPLLLQATKFVASGHPMEKSFSTYRENKLALESKWKDVHGEYEITAYWFRYNLRYILITPTLTTDESYAESQKLGEFILAKIQELQTARHGEASAFVEGN